MSFRSILTSVRGDVCRLTPRLSAATSCPRVVLPPTLVTCTVDPGGTATTVAQSDPTVGDWGVASLADMARIGASRSIARAIGPPCALDGPAHRETTQAR